MAGEEYCQQHEQDGQGVQQQLQTAQAIEEATHQIQHQHQPHNHRRCITKAHNQRLIGQRRQHNHQAVRQQGAGQNGQFPAQRIVGGIFLQTPKPNESRQRGINKCQTNHHNWHSKLPDLRISTMTQVV